MTTPYNPPTTAQADTPLSAPPHRLETAEDDASLPSPAFSPINPRIGLDLRAGAELLEADYIVDAFMSQFSQLKEVEELSSTPVALISSAKEWPGFLRYAKAEKRLTRFSLLPSWERQFADSAQLGLWHQFSPADLVRSAGSRPSLVTLLPAQGKLPKHKRLSPQTSLIVSSHANAEVARNIFRVAADRVHVLTPVIRPFLLENSIQRETHADSTNEGWFLFVIGKKKDLPRTDKWIDLLSSRYPRVARKLINLETDSTNLRPENWPKILERTKACFYFASSPFDWAVPAFEAMYARVPTVFLDGCSVISELLPQFPLSLPRFLLDTPDGAKMAEHAEKAFIHLQREGVFDPKRFAERTLNIQRQVAESCGI